LLNVSCCLLQTLLLLTIQANSFVYNWQRILNIILILSSFSLIWLSVCEWNDVDNFVSMPNILFNFFVNSAANCSLLFDTTLSGNLCNFHILFLNNYTNLSTDVLSVVVIKYVILTNLSQTTKIIFFSAATATCLWSQMLDESIVSLVPHLTSASLLVSLFDSLFSNIYYNHPHIFLYLLSFPATNSIIFHLSLCPATRLSLLVICQVHLFQRYISMVVMQQLSARYPVFHDRNTFIELSLP